MHDPRHFYSHSGRRMQQQILHPSAAAWKQGAADPAIFFDWPAILVVDTGSRSSRRAAGKSTYRNALP